MKDVIDALLADKVQTDLSNLVSKIRDLKNSTLTAALFSLGSLAAVEGNNTEAIRLLTECISDADHETYEYRSAKFELKRLASAPPPQ